MIVLTKNMTYSICPAYSASHKKEDESEISSIDLPDFPEWKIRLYSNPDGLRKLVNWPSSSSWMLPGWMAYQSEAFEENSTHLLEIETNTGAVYRLSVQTFVFQAGNNIRQAQAQFSWRRWLAAPFRFKVLALGQLLNSGPYSLSNDQVLLDSNWGKLIDQLSQVLSHRLSCKAVLIKDLSEEDSEVTNYWTANSFYSLPVDPVMELPIRTHWSTFDDYLMDLTSKYRVRYRRARKQAGGLSTRILPPSEVYRRESELDDLFQAVRITADYDPIDPPAGYFSALQREWDYRCQIMGYFLDEKLVGFTTALLDNQCLHAHYLGFVQEVNQTHHIYHNMLFDLIGYAIQKQVDKLNFSRTALEIKSSVGAIPKRYAVLLKANWSLGNWMVRRFTPSLFQAQRWQARNPFRAS